LTSIDIESTINTVRVGKMNKENLKILINDLEIAINELRAEVYSDTESYLDKDNVRRVHTYDDDGDYE
tara:strand:+ start:697 stop:900 length:204 start_codon:yes stop_codon:yes gene_type:complete